MWDYKKKNIYIRSKSTDFRLKSVLMLIESTGLTVFFVLRKLLASSIFGGNVWKRVANNVGTSQNDVPFCFSIFNGQPGIMYTLSL